MKLEQVRHWIGVGMLCLWIGVSYPWFVLVLLIAYSGCISPQKYWQKMTTYIWDGSTAP